MRRILLFAASAFILFAAAACSHQMAYRELYPKDYLYHKNTLYIKVHWNLPRPDANTVIADGFVQPFSPGDGVHTVRLELVGLDESGNVVNKAEGRPVDSYIASPLGTSPFRIEMKLNGKEEDFTITGSYYHYDAGEKPDFSTNSLDNIPLKSDEPL